MSLESHFCLLAEYNQWMNLKVYESAGRLSREDLMADRGAFFRSVLGTLNHIVVADIIWLKRFATHPSCGSLLLDIVDLPNPASLDHILYDDFEALSECRYWLDEQIINWTGALTADDLNFVLSYRNTKGIAANKRFASLLLHFFNHQTHHRGQVSTLLSQAGEDVGVTDLLALIKEEIQQDYLSASAKKYLINPMVCTVNLNELPDAFRTGNWQLEAERDQSKFTDEGTRQMPFTEEEKSRLLAVKGVGPTVLKRFEEVGLDSFEKLASHNASEVVALVSSMLQSKCWTNTKAVEAVDAAIQQARKEISN